MSSARVLEPLPLDLPPVEEVPRMPGGFLAAATTVGIKASGRPDLGLLTTVGRLANVAATFTTNSVRAAPVRLSEAHLLAGEPAGGGRWGRAAAVLSTSGCANAATGRAGEDDQAALAAALADRLHIERQQTLAISTGLIGTRLPVERVEAALPVLVAQLSPGDEALAALAEQICTTDTRPKWASTRLELPDRDGWPMTVTVSGIAKGVGMIHPRMATMLALILTDAWIDPGVLHGMLAAAVAGTWNQLTVDGDTSTNDTVFLLASGASGATSPTVASSAAGQLGRAVMAVARSLARQQAADGEGATTLISCQVSGARDDHQARAVARAVVASSLVKACVHGRDPNWGRIVAAAGNARVDDRPVSLDESRLAVALAGVTVFDGQPVAFDKAALSALMDAPELLVRVDLGRGSGTGEAFGCDLTEQYVLENSAYST
jgi:glutamate N-acetyltransferase / amino-acid N-acetyltransferase